MNKQLRALTRIIFAMFFALFVAVSMIQIVSADSLHENALNQRTRKEAFEVERGSILVGDTSVAYSVPSGDEYHFQRKYVDGPLYAPITGYFSYYQGSSGLERAENAELAGAGNAQFFNRIMRILNGAEPQGSSVRTTVNAKAQKAAYDALQGFEGAAVAIEPKTGKILAMVSTPSYDPNLLSSNDSSEIIKNYHALEADAKRPLINRAIAGDTYHPGSTFKIITAAAAIEAGLANPQTKLPDLGSYTLPDTESVAYNNDRGLCGGSGGETTLEQAIVQSCNIPMMKLAEQLPLGDLTKFAQKFGFEQELQIPLGVTASQAPKPANYAQQDLSAIGQWSVSATPLQMALVSAGIANGGTVMRPTLVDEIITPDLQLSSQTKPEVFSRPLSQTTADAVKSMMVRGVQVGAARNARIEGVEVAGKTGTAENGRDEQGKNLPFTLWFTGFAPANNPEIAVAVVVENGGGATYNFQGYSSEIPTKIGKTIMEAVLKK